MHIFPTEKHIFKKPRSKNPISEAASHPCALRISLYVVLCTIVYVTIQLDLMFAVRYNFLHADNAGIMWAREEEQSSGLEKSKGGRVRV